MRKHRCWAVLIVLALGLMLTGCSTPSAGIEEKEGKNPPSAVELGGTGPGAAQARLVVSRDYGREVILDSWQPVKEGVNALELTASCLPVKTTYGGKFVEAISGLQSGKSSRGPGLSSRVDWFLYHNGSLSSQGAADLKPQIGDIVYWDFHEWEGAAFTPAMIGAFPHPFQQGVNIFYTASSKGLAGKMKNLLYKRGIKTITLQEFKGDALKKAEKPAMVLGLWQELQDSPEIKRLTAKPLQSGIFCQITEKGLQALDAWGQPRGKIYSSSSACICATGGMGQPPLWLVLGYDHQGVEQAIHFLDNYQAQALYAWGVLVTEKGTEALPAH